MVKEESNNVYRLDRRQTPPRKKVTSTLESASAGDAVKLILCPIGGCLIGNESSV